MISELIGCVLTCSAAILTVQVPEDPVGNRAVGTRSAVQALVDCKKPEVIPRGPEAPRTAMDRVSQLANHMDWSHRPAPAVAHADRLARARPIAARARMPYYWTPRIYPGRASGYGSFFGSFGYPYPYRYGYGYGYGYPYYVPAYGVGFAFGASISPGVTIRYADPLGRQWKMVDDGIRKFAGTSQVVSQ